VALERKKSYESCMEREKERLVANHKALPFPETYESMVLLERNNNMNRR
jgi:hypothetical protein